MEEHLLVRALMAERSKVLAYIQSLVRDVDLAEDVFQDVCVLAVRKRSSIENVAHLLNWLRTASRLTALNACRKRGDNRRMLGSHVLELLEPEWVAADADDNSATKEALHKCLRGLSPQMQSLVRRRYFEGLDYVKLSSQTRRSVSSLYVTFSRLFAALGDCIARELRSAGGTHG